MSRRKHAGKPLADTLATPEKLTASAIAALHKDQLTPRQDGKGLHQGVSPDSVATAIFERIAAMSEPENTNDWIRRILISNSVLLQNMIAIWTARMASAETYENMERFGRLVLNALREQQRTLSGLAQLQSERVELNSSVVFLKESTELLETLHDKIGLDPRATAKAIGFDPLMATLEKEHRTEVGGGEAQGEHERTSARLAESKVSGSSQ